MMAFSALVVILLIAESAFATGSGYYSKSSIKDKISDAFNALKRDRERHVVGMRPIKKSPFHKTPSGSDVMGSEPCTPLLELGGDVSAVIEAFGLTKLGTMKGTYFLPTNDQFKALLAVQGVTDLAAAFEEPTVVDGLTALLSYHFAPETTAFSEEFTATPTVLETALDSVALCDDPITSLSVFASGGKVSVKDSTEVATVTTADVEVCEGVAHYVNKILNPCADAINMPDMPDEEYEPAPNPPTYGN